MKKNARRNVYSGTYTSPGTPEYYLRETPKYWSSERIPLPTNNTKTHISSSPLMPFNSAKNLPSKWDDAERWITSPISGDGSLRSPAALPQRRPKSKSGPLAPAELAYLSNYSPVAPALESGGFAGKSPLATGALVPDGLSIDYNNGGGGAGPDSLYGTADISRGTSVPGLSDSLGESSITNSRDDKGDVGNEDEALVSRALCGRDTTTHMSPERGTNYNSSPKGQLSFSNLRPTAPVSSRPIRNLADKDEIRDVQVDKGTTTVKPSKRQGLRKAKRDSADVGGLHYPWNASEASRSASKIQREEAKITAWENLQKAKAEAEIRELEMKLERKRSESMDRIMNKLRAAQMKAQATRNLVSKENHVPSISRMGFSCCKCVDTCSLSNRYIRRRN